MGWPMFGLFLSGYKHASSHFLASRPPFQHSGEAKPSCHPFIAWAQCGGGCSPCRLTEIQKLLPAGNSPNPALCHHQQLRQLPEIQLSGHPSLCLLGISKEKASEEVCSLATASLLLARVPRLHSRDLSKLRLPAQGQECFDCLGVFSSAGSLAALFCDWKHFPAHHLLGKEKCPKTRHFVGKRCNAGVDGSMSGQRQRRALPVMITLSLKQVLLSQEQLWHPFIGLQYYHTLRRKLSPILHVCTREKGKTGEGLACSCLGAKD